MLFIMLLIVLSVQFKESSYTINERNNKDVQIQPVLMLSNTSSTEITVNIQSNDITATGKCPLVILLL